MPAVGGGEYKDALERVAGLTELRYVWLSQILKQRQTGAILLYVKHLLVETASRENSAWR